MNPKKRKADDEDPFDSKESYQDKVNESETADINASNCGSSECGNSMDDQKSDNGGSSEQPSTSGKVSGEQPGVGINQSPDQREKKHIHLEGPKTAGVLLFCGGTNWDLIGRKELPKNAKDAVGRNLWGPHRMASLKGIRVTAVFSGSCAVHSVIIIEGGQAMTWERRPCLWDKRNALYKNKVVRDKCWEEISKFLDDEYEEKTFEKKKQMKKNNEQVSEHT